MILTTNNSRFVDALRGLMRQAEVVDSAHDMAHLERVLVNALRLQEKEGGDIEVLTAASLLHDSKNYPKGHPEAHLSSRRSAEYACEVLATLEFPEEKLPIVFDAIECHSFSSGLTPKTLEGKVLQDADRLDSLGAVGLARVFIVGGSFGAELYHPEDPFDKTGRVLEDRKYIVDHFYTKILKLPDLMQTATGKELAQTRSRFMLQYLEDLAEEITRR